MTRFLLVPVVVLGCVIAAPTAPSTRKPAKPPVAPRVDNPQSANPNEAKEQYVMTPDTVVLLDEQPSSFDAIPDDAVISNMEVAPDRKTIVRVFFRTKAK